MRCKLFQKPQHLLQHQNQEQEQEQEQNQHWQQLQHQHQQNQHWQHSAPASPVQPAYPMSRTAQWVAQQAHQEYQLVQPRLHRRQQQRQYEQEYHALNTPDWQAPQQTSRRTHRKRHQTPLMDLSSLEGPPIEDARLLHTTESMIPQVREEPATPCNPPPSLLWKPLPPRPASAEPQSSRQLRLDIPRHERQSYFEDRSTALDTTQRGRRGIFEEETFFNQGHQLGPAPTTNRNIPQPRARAQPGTQTQIRTQAQAQAQLPWIRTQSSNPLIWLEDEEQWVISHSPISRSSHPPLRRLPSRLQNATIRPPPPWPDGEVRGPDMDISVLGGEDVEWVGTGVPPDYESHQFSPTHVQQLTSGSALRARGS